MLLLDFEIHEVETASQTVPVLCSTRCSDTMTDQRLHKIVVYNLNIIAMLVGFR